MKRFSTGVRVVAIGLMIGFLALGVLGTFHPPFLVAEEMHAEGGSVEFEPSRREFVMDFLTVRLPVGLPGLGVGYSILTINWKRVRITPLEFGVIVPARFVPEALGGGHDFLRLNFRTSAGYSFFESTSGKLRHYALVGLAYDSIGKPTYREEQCPFDRTGLAISIGYELVLRLGERQSFSIGTRALLSGVVPLVANEEWSEICGLSGTVPPTRHYVVPVIDVFVGF